MLPGRIDLLVKQFDRVEQGTLLFRIDSPGWRDLQGRLADAVALKRQLAIKLTTFTPLREAHNRHQDSLAKTVDLWNDRVKQLETIRDAGGGRAGALAEARGTLTRTQADLANLQEEHAVLEAREAETSANLQAAEYRFDFLLDSASVITGLGPAALLETVEDGSDARPRWITIDAIDVLAANTGIIESLGVTNGAWADEQTDVLSVVQPEQLRFHALGLQSDLGVLRDGLQARIVPPTPTASGRSIPIHDTMSGTLSLGLQGDAAGRTVDLYVEPETLSAWARPGVSAQLEIVTDATSGTDLAIPLAAVQRDGLKAVIFRRAPDNPNEAIWLEVDLGADDGRWVSVLSGLRDGDEVVLDGGFQLMLSMSGSMPKGGHFHADGTFHEESH
jgi:multidrug efflux pump subunit AcrA (membrane-fusion protein)